MKEGDLGQKKFVGVAAALAAFGIAGIAVLSWWTAESSEPRLRAKGIEMTSAVVNMPAPREWWYTSEDLAVQSKLQYRSRSGPFELVYFDVVVPRVPMTTSQNDVIKPTGEWKGRLRSMLHVERPNVRTWPIQRPMWTINMARWAVSEQEEERLWERLAREPANAAFDARILMATPMKSEAPVVYLSALRRLKLWAAAVEFAESEGFNSPLRASGVDWLKRAEAELKALEAAPMAEEDRRRFKNYLSSVGRPLLAAYLERAAGL
jgi:hypothetical protein